MVLIALMLLGSTTQGQEVVTEGTVFTSSQWIDSKMREQNFPAITIYNTLGEYHGEPTAGTFTGVIRSTPFPAPRNLDLLMGGAMGYPGIRLELKQVDTGETLELKTWRRVESMKLIRWVTPANWRGKSVQLVAIDENPAQEYWIGLSMPLASVPQPLLQSHWKHFLFSLINLALPLLVFLCVGYAGYLLIVRFWDDAHRFALPIILAFPLPIAYLQFYTAIRSLWAAYLLGTCALILAVINILKTPKNQHAALRETWRWYRPFFFLALMFVVLSTAILHLGWTPHNSVRLAQERFVIEQLPLDNYLPLLTVNRLYDQDSLKPFIIEWRSTDRPPLQAAACLFVRPFMLDSVEGYQIFSAWLHTTVLLGIAFLLHCMGLARHRALILVAMLAFSGTFLINTLFVWPKLYPAFFPLVVTGMLFRENSVPRSIAFWLLAGSLSAFALLIHPGSLFALAAIFGIFVLQHRRICWQQLAAAVIVFILLMLPWSLFQKTFDPPGDIMQKRFFANYPYLDDLSFLEALRLGYGELTPLGWLQGRWQNVKVVFGDFTRAFGEDLFQQIPSESLLLRTYVFTFIGISLVPLIFAYIPAFFLRKSIPDPIRFWLLRTHAICAIGLLAWIVLILPSGRTIISHGSYYFPVMLMLLPLVMIQHRWPWVVGMFAIQVFYFFLIWGMPAFTSFYEGGILHNIAIVNPGTAVTMIVTAAGILALLAKVWIHETPRSCQSQKSKNPEVIQ